MQCEEVEFKLLELIEEELPPAQRTEVLAHLHGCATCATELSAYHDLFALVQADPVPEPPPSFWEEFLPSLKRRIEQEASRRKPTSATWLAGTGSWFAFRPRLIAGFAAAAVSIFIVVRLPNFLPVRTDRQVTSISTEKVVDQNGVRHSVAVEPHPYNGQHPGEPFVVAGEVVEEPAILVAAIQRLRWVDEIMDPLETAWVLRPEADPADSLASLDENERQILLDHLSRFGWSKS